MKLKELLFGKYEYHKKSNDGKLDVRLDFRFGILPVVAIILLIILLMWLF